MSPARAQARRPATGEEEVRTIPEAVIRRFLRTAAIALALGSEGHALAAGSGSTPPRSDAAQRGGTRSEQARPLAISSTASQSLTTRRQTARTAALKMRSERCDGF